MQNPARYGFVVDLAMLFVTVLYIAFGALAYLFFGEATNSVITENLGEGWEADVVRVCISAVLLCGYPLQMFPVLKILEGAILPPTLKGNTDTLVRNMFRVVVVAASIAVAVSVPLFGYFAALVGAFSNSFLAFIFPPLFYLKLFGWQTPSWRWALCIFVVAGMPLSCWHAFVCVSAFFR